MAKKNKPELTLEELQAKKSRRQRGWVRFCAILLAVLLTVGIYGFAAKGDPRTVELYTPSAQQVVVQNGGQNTDTPATEPVTQAPSTSTPPTSGGDSSSSSGGILDMLLGLLGNIDLSSIAGMLDLDGLGVTVADGIDNLQSMLIGLLDRIEGSLTGQPVISHDPVEYNFSGELGSEEDRAAVAELLNAATADASFADYNFTRTASYTPNGHVDIGDQTTTLDQILSAANLSLDGVVGSFMGVGTVSGRCDEANLPNIQQNGQSNYLLKGTTLTADDIQIVNRATSTDGNITNCTVRLKNVDNPNRLDVTGLNSFTSDFIVQNEIADQIANAIQVAGTSISVLKLTDLETAYSDIKVQFVYNAATGQLSNLSYSYTVYGKFTVRTNTVQIVGDATTTVTNNYTGFTYNAVNPAG